MGSIFAVGETKMFKTFKVYYSFLLKRKVIFFGFLLLVVVTSILHGVQPYFYKLFVEAIPSRDYGVLFNVLILYLLTRVLTAVFSVINFIVGDYILFESAKDARVAVVKQIQKLDFAFHSSKSTGSLISAVKRGDGSFFDLFHQIHHRILEVLIGFGVMVYFFSKLNIWISIIAIATFAISIFITRYIVAYNVKTRSEFNEEEDNISGIIVDNLINYETVKLFAKERWEIDRLNTAFKGWMRTLWKYGNSFRFLDVSMDSIINLSIFVILLFSLKSTTVNAMSVGDFILVVGFLNSFYPRIYDLVWSFRNIAKNYSDMHSYLNILDFDVTVKDPENERKVENVMGDVEFDNVSFSYKEGKSRAVKNISLRAKPGESIALVGRSGVGKTTLVRLLMRFFDVDSGSILIDGINIKEFSKSRLRSFMGVVPQEPILFNNTIGYNIGYGKNNPTQEEIKAASKLANLDKFIEGLPKKYDTHVGERGIKLSGGQKQRLAIARMILSNPDIVIFDEATSQLDSESEKLIQDAFWKAVKDKTTFIIAHRLSTISRADKIVVMEKGRVAEVGTHKELLLNTASLYSHFWNLQVKKE